MTDTPQQPTVDPATAAFTAKMMAHYKAQRDQLEIQVAALDGRLAAAVAEVGELKTRIAGLEAAPAEEPVEAAAAVAPATPRRKES